MIIRVEERDTTSEKCERGKPWTEKELRDVYKRKEKGKINNEMRK